jgi:pimeloyl-ACP methyl ester carboxylesterase
VRSSAVAPFKIHVPNAVLVDLRQRLGHARYADEFEHVGWDYQEIQSTKPQSLGQGLSDSPLGLASWIVEKWYDWSDHEGDFSKAFTKDDILTNVMIYWVTNSGTSSARIYYESRHMLGGALPPTPFVQPGGRVTAPTGCGAFPRQYDRRSNPLITDTEAVRKAAEARFNLVHFATMPHGGHFPALEQPTLWVDDIRAFFREAVGQPH